ncbi:MAG: FKBP-type peptidyl-prolyl cis-trans isomerase [Pseudomonadales bacterium]
MKLIQGFTALVALLAIIACQPQHNTEADPKESAEEGSTAAAGGPALDTLIQKVSYSIGVNFGTQFATQEIDIDVDAFMAGMNTGRAGEKPLLSQEQVVEAMQTFEGQQREKMEIKQNQLGEKNKQEGEAFLAENATKDGVVTTDSGLQYKVITEGSGKKPAADDTVKVHYHGTLINDKVFDSSVDRGEPVEFGVGQVIPGWTEALQLMPIGSKWEVYIPSDLAYGPGGRQGIEPNSTLIFEVELLEIVAPEKNTDKG